MVVTGTLRSATMIFYTDMKQRSYQNRKHPEPARIDFGSRLQALKFIKDNPGYEVASVAPPNYDGIHECHFYYNHDTNQITVVYYKYLSEDWLDYDEDDNIEISINIDELMNIKDDIYLDKKYQTKYDEWKKKE